jgi:AAHS family 4-hydroxybenzoate transporter-like MFS transporter
VTVSTLSVGTPLGGTVVGWLAPALAATHGWRGAFVVFGVATLLLVVIILAALRDSPSFFLGKGKPDAAARVARLVFKEPVPLIPDQHASATNGGVSVGVLHRSNMRLNTGIGIAFAACALVAYGILNWSTTFLTAAGFTLEQAGFAVSVCGITSMLGSFGAGLLTRRFGSRRVMAVISATVFVLLVALAFTVEVLPATPTVAERTVVVLLIGGAGAFFSAGIATMYVIMALGYPQSCRSAGIGFGIFMSRVGAIAASGLGGALLDFGAGSVLPFFTVLCVGAVLVSAAAFIVDRHVPPSRG